MQPLKSNELDRIADAADTHSHVEYDYTDAGREIADYNFDARGFLRELEAAGFLVIRKSDWNNEKAKQKAGEAFGAEAEAADLEGEDFKAAWRGSQGLTSYRCEG